MSVSDQGDPVRKAARVLLLAAAFATPLALAAPASAVPCAEVYGVPPFNAEVIVCVNEFGCLVYQHSSSLVHIQQPVCLLPVPA